MEPCGYDLKPDCGNKIGGLGQDRLIRIDNWNAIGLEFLNLMYFNRCF